MTENYLITGYWGEPHVTPENDRGFNAAVFGSGRFVLPVGEQFRAEYIGNNTVRVYDGKLIDNGAVAGIPAGEYVDLTVRESGQGMKRNDIICFQYSKDASSLVESGSFVVVSGAETNGTPADPAVTQQNLLTNEATFDQMPLWRVPVSATVISAPERISETRFAGEKIVNANSNDGTSYTAELPGVGALYAGLEITLIPGKTSDGAPTLNLNGLGAVPICARIADATAPNNATVNLVASQPLRVCYNGNTWVAEVFASGEPDCLDGVEYLTKEKWNGKPVYTRLVYLGETNTGTMMFDFGVSVNHVVRDMCWVDGRPLMLQYNSKELNCAYTFDGTSVRLHHGTALKKIYFQAWYTK